MTKLFNITLPSRAYFGKKDYQQLKIIERFTEDLNIPVSIIACPIVREKEGLALSSRNRYLSVKEHTISLNIYKTLQLARDLIKFKKEKNTEKIKRIVKKTIQEIKGIKLEYFEILGAENLDRLIK